MAKIINRKRLELEHKFMSLIDQYNKGLYNATEFSDGLIEIAMDELREVRAVYDQMESKETQTTGTDWRKWKGVRNVITNHIEAITGSRQ